MGEMLKKTLFAFFGAAVLLSGSDSRAQVVPNTPSRLKAEILKLGSFKMVQADRFRTRDGKFIRLLLKPRKPGQWAVFSSGALQAAGAVYAVMKINPKDDKTRHFFAGYAAASFSHGMMEIIMPNDLKHRRLISFLAGVGASVSAGIAKEYWDSLGHGHADAKDAEATALGGVAGSTVGTFVSSIVIKVHASSISNAVEQMGLNRETIDDAFTDGQ